MPSIEAEFDALPKAFSSSDFAFTHQADRHRREDGDVDRKLFRLGSVDLLLAGSGGASAPRLSCSSPGPLHPSSMNPIPGIPPVLMRGGTTFVDDTKEFGETACRRGGARRFPAHATSSAGLGRGRRLDKFGA